MKAKVKSMKVLITLIILSLSCNGFLFYDVTHAAIGPTSKDFLAVHDFFVDNSGHYPNGDSQYNPKSGNWVGNSNNSAFGEARAAVQFNLSSLTGTVSVSSAQFKIYVNSIDGSPDLYQLWGSVNDNWDDNQPTMISKDQLLNTYTGPFNVPALNQGQWITVDVTNFVKGKMSDNKIVSFVLTGNSSGLKAFNFNSKESTDKQSNLYGPANHPTLSVTYTIKSNNADLSGLTLSNGTLSPAFVPGTQSYSATVGSGVTSVNIIPTLADSTASVQVNGTATASGTAVLVSLNTGANTITVVVTAEDGTTQKTYTVTVTRAASSNADLSNLTISAGTLTPDFDSSTTTYTATVANGVSSINITPTVADSTTAVKVNGSSATSGSAVPVQLNAGSNVITVTATAQDGTTQKTYTVTVHRLSNNADLADLQVDGTTVTGFASGNTGPYLVSVPNAATSVNVTYTKSDSQASVTITGDSGLSVGNNTVKVTVTAEDGTTKVYTITVQRISSPPVTQLLANSSAPTNGWYNTDIIVQLIANSTSGSGIDRTYYKVNGGSLQEYSAPFTLSGSGLYTVEYYSRDLAGNIENANSTMLKVDKAAPITKSKLNPIWATNKTGLRYISGYTVTLTATDDFSGVKQTWYKVNDGAWTVYTVPFNANANPNLKVEYYSVDNAGNSESTL